MCRNLTEETWIGVDMRPVDPNPSECDSDSQARTMNIDEIRRITAQVEEARRSLEPKRDLEAEKRIGEAKVETTVREIVAKTTLQIEAAAHQGARSMRVGDLVEFPGGYILSRVERHFEAQGFQMSRKREKAGSFQTGEWSDVYYVNWGQGMSPVPYHTMESVGSVETGYQ